MSYLLGGEAATRHGVRRGAYSTKGRAWHHRAGEDVRAARASFVTIAGEPNPSPPLQHVEEQLFFVRGGFFTCAASRSEFSNVVPRRRRDGCGLGRFARLDVRRGLRRTRAGARVGNAPVA